MTRFGAEFFRHSPEMLCVADFNGHFVELSTPWTETLGYSIEELLQLPFFDLVHPNDIQKTKDEYYKFVGGEDYKTTNFINRFRHKNGHYRWLQWSASSDKNEKKIFCIVRDVTEERREINVLLEAQEVTQVGSWEIDLSTGDLFWSKMTHKIHETDPLTYHPKLEDGINFFNFEARDILEGKIKSLMENGNSYDLELPFITAKGKKTWVRCVGRASMYDNVVLRAYGTIEDIGLKRKEKSLYELIIENGNYGTWDWDLETNQVHFNDRWCSLVGLDVTKVKHDLATWDALAHPDDKIIAYRDIEDHLNGKTPYYRNVHRMKHADGHWVWILDQGKVVETRDGKPVRFSGTHTDITYVKELENERGLLNDRFKLVLAAIKFGVWEWNIKTNALAWDESMYELFDVSPNDFSGDYTAWEKTVHPDDKELVAAALQASIVDGIDFDTSFRIVLKNGHIRHIAAKGYVERDSNGKALRFSGINWDITKNVEQERIFETILNNIPIMITFYNHKGDVEWINPHWSEVLGWTLDDMKKVRDMAINLFATEREQQEAIQFMMEAPPEWREFTLVKKNGELAHTTWTNVRLEDGQIIGIGQDIGEKRMQEELIKDQQARMISSAKLSSLGEMASGIAHEINNPLAIIKGKAYQILKRLENGEVNVDFLSREISKIEQNSLRIVKIIKGLRTFSRHGEADPFKAVAFKSILDDVLELCYERFKYQGVELKVSGDLSTEIRCQETQLAQVVLNLINNAHDAVVDTPRPWVHVHADNDGEALRITVTDSGPGISEEIAQKIMQPFFTTKEVGMGTGLGLSISKGIVEIHGGRLFLDRNCPNTRFIIDLPLKK
ncbi:hypothetical protein C0V70_09845 [Bacteriovorax stolpii]|uniref:histidine kinase n=1 Tax=Bacteriovorax stolpii TaxID=960 RepID=A0A2K9NSD3_BACTC|nr:PAS domain-containing protein [Bacteriovorax stolpii]AUN98402.1 hypothetical protein C0V70_09845 [Bacteriovorax stolpii]TDP50977.1 PAS domain S-box-containing protein [Bacteriovorax stolpii]